MKLSVVFSLCLWFSGGLFVLQLVVQGPSPGVRAGHTAVTIGPKASNVTNILDK